MNTLTLKVNYVAIPFPGVEPCLLYAFSSGVNACTFCESVMMCVCVSATATISAFRG